jgi:hypothetical protein
LQQHPLFVPLRRRLALVIGVNDYAKLPGPDVYVIAQKGVPAPLVDLRGGVPDALAMADLLTRIEWAEDDVFLCISPTKANTTGTRRWAATGPDVRAALREMGARARHVRDPYVLVHFSGYGRWTAEQGHCLLLADGTLLPIAEVEAAFSRCDIGWVLDTGFGIDRRPGGRSGGLVKEPPLPGPVRNSSHHYEPGEPAVETQDKDGWHGQITRHLLNVVGDVNPEIWGGHTGYRVSDILGPDGAPPIGVMVVTGPDMPPAGVWQPGRDHWFWNLDRTVPWPDMFRLAARPDGTLPQLGSLAGWDVSAAETFTGKSAPSVLPDPNVGKLYQLSRRAAGVTEILDAHLWRRKPFGQPPLQDWYSSVFDPHDCVPFGTNDELLFSRISASLPANPNRRVLQSQPLTP